MLNKYIFILTSLLISIVCVQAMEINSASDPAKEIVNALTKNQQYKLSLWTKDHKAPPIGEYHSWVISVTDSLGKPIESVRFNISGGMPAHGHGLPSQPRVTEYLGNGQYLLEGVLFGMAGAWQLNVSMLRDQQRDSAVVDIYVDY